MAGQISVRAAGPDDVPDLVLMIDELHAAEWTHLPLDRIKALHHLLGCLEAGVVLLALVGDDPAGVLMLAPDSYWFSDRIVLVDRMFYVRPQFRRQRVWHALLREAKAISAETGVPVYFVNSSNTATNRKDRLYGRYLTSCGHIFRHDPGRG
jgi:GNAT superfamily N-acetyltransferase